MFSRLFASQGPVDLWRRAFWVPVGVGRSKCEQHLYRCCVIFIALLHLLGGISFSVNNQVNCTQTRSGTPANFFYCYANSSNFFLPSLPTPITKSFPFTPSISSHESSFTPKLFLPPQRRDLWILKGKVAERYAVMDLPLRR